MPGTGKALGRPSGAAVSSSSHTEAFQGRPGAGGGLGRPDDDVWYQTLPVNLLCILPPQGLGTGVGHQVQG